jgi:hypothetical protein
MFSCEIGRRKVFSFQGESRGQDFELLITPERHGWEKKKF